MLFAQLDVALLGVIFSQLVSTLAAKFRKAKHGFLSDWGKRKMVLSLDSGQKNVLKSQTDKTLK